jgi:hypothetical protein
LTLTVRGRQFSLREIPIAEQFAAPGISPTFKREPRMPYTRPVRRFYLTPPKVLTFIISLVLAILAVLAVYGHLVPLHGINGFVFLLVAYLVLAAGTLVRGI